MKVKFPMFFSIPKKRTDKQKLRNASREITKRSFVCRNYVKESDFHHKIETVKRLLLPGTP